VSTQAASCWQLPHFLGVCLCATATAPSRHPGQQFCCGELWHWLAVRSSQHNVRLPRDPLTVFPGVCFTIAVRPRGRG
jgi:hypothetical protein